MPTSTHDPTRTTPAAKHWRFGAMIATSTAVMFMLMYLNTYQASHIHWSETRF